MDAAGTTAGMPAAPSPPPPHLRPKVQALQEPLGVALGVLEEVETFRQALVAQDVARVRLHPSTSCPAEPGMLPSVLWWAPRCHAAVRQLPAHLPKFTAAGIHPPIHAHPQAQDVPSPDASAAGAAQACKRLQELVGRLDSVLPYLTLAISTVALLAQGACGAAMCCPLAMASWYGIAPT